jgi:Do/DeqQ family serine protease
MSLLRRFWLLFAQACTLCLAALFVVVTLKPEWLPRPAARGNPVVLLQEDAAPAAEAADHADAAGGPRGQVVPAGSHGQAGTAATGGVASYAAAAHRAMPAVVNIYTSKAVRSRNPLLDDPLLRRYFPDLSQLAPRRATSLGSGVIVSADGYVLTNLHVIDGADEIALVLADGRELSARVRGTDPDSDLAVLKTDATGLPAITFAPPDSVQVGDVVLAIGNPFGFGNTVTSGIVSALGRNHLGVNRFEDFIQTDAAINPGNSGGALVDAAGRLVGINSTIYSQSGGSMGIGFAIPVSLARNVLTQIIADGEVTRGWLGIEPQAVTREVAQALALTRPEGVLIRALQQDGPAQKAGVRTRDVIVEVGGQPTRDVPQLLARIAELRPGSSARLKLWRDGQLQEVNVTVARRPRLP